MRPGKVSVNRTLALPPIAKKSRSPIRARCSEKISGSDYYRELSEKAIQYGPFFHSIAQLWRDGKMSWVNCDSTDRIMTSIPTLHPAVLDGGLQVFGAAVATQAKRIGEQGTYMPTRIDRIRVLAVPAPTSGVTRA